MTITWFHTQWAWVAIVLAGATGLWGLGLALLRRQPGRPFRMALRASVAAMVLQVATGLVLYATGERPGTLHVFYGVVIVATFSFAYVYRTQLEERPALRWGVLLLFVMGLGIRAMLTFASS